MPVEIRKGNLFDYEGSKAHGVNGAGAMGKGIAVQFKKSWPNMFAEYERLCKAGQFFPGMIYAYEYHQINSAVFADFRKQMTDNLHDLEGKPVSQETLDAVKEASVKAITSVTLDLNNLSTTNYIYNLCIKSHWRLPSETYMIWTALQNMVEHMESHGITEVAMPAIGCGLGQLDWETQVKPIVEQVGSQTPCTLVVYLPV
jgi:O-acetyl-ADP-ribose deacetylase (regulator of RNase III)